MQSTQNGRPYSIIGLTNMPRRKSAQKIVSLLCFYLAVVVLLGVADANGGIYVSDAITAEFVNASYTKAVDNTNPRNVSTQKGRVNRAESNSTGGINGFGYVLGYRIPLGSGGFFLSGEIDLLLFHEGRVYGDIEEKGTSEAPNQLGESWSEDWTFERDDNYGFTVMLGGNPGLLKAWKANVYALAGVRYASSRLEAYYNGCFKPGPCVVGEYDSERLAKNFHVAGWTGGVGVEKKLFHHTWLEVEGRYTSYNTEQWVTPFPDLGVEVTSESVNQTITLRFNVVIR